IAVLRADLERAHGPELLADELNILRNGERVVYWVRVLDRGGSVRAETAGMKSNIPPEAFPSPNESSSSKEFRVGKNFFALTSASEAVDGQDYIIQVAQDRSSDRQFTRWLRILLFWLIAVGSLASALIAIRVTRRGLRPLVDMTQALERVGPKRLNERVPPTGWPRELQPLVLAFDQMLDRLEDSFTRLSQFSADLAHELRTPIANLRGESEVALTRPRAPEEYREVLESSVAECERLSGIIENLLFLARAEAANGSVERKIFESRATIEKVVSFYESVADERRITLAIQGGGPIYADPLLFSRALSNLVENALRFTADGGRIEIAIFADEQESVVTVTDNGSGIEAEHLPRVFDRFYRADSSRSSQGTGLGLALVRSIMHLHGGTATVESEAGRGTLVRLKFPNESKQTAGVS
ncbi:MAG: heavy metal sensor histidine kinase, partial [Chthoniobacterales bacterium]